MVCSIDFARFSFELGFGDHRWDTVFYDTKRYVGMFAAGSFDETFNRNLRSNRRSFLVVKFMQNRLKNGSDLGFRTWCLQNRSGWRSGVEFGSILAPFWCPGAVWSDPWALVGRPWTTLGGLSGASWPPLGAPGRLLGAPGTLLGPSWAPWGRPGSIWDHLEVDLGLFWDRIELDFG